MAKKANSTKSVTTTVNASEAVRRAKYDRKARVYNWTVSLYEQMIQQGKSSPGDVLEMVHPVIKDHVDYVVVWMGPDLVNGTHMGAGAIVRNAHPNTGKYDRKKSKALATKIGKLVAQMAQPERADYPHFGAAELGRGAPQVMPGMNDPRESAHWCFFEMPAVDEDGAVIPMKPYREARAPKSPEETAEKAKKAAGKAKAKAAKKTPAKAKGKAAAKPKAKAKAKPKTKSKAKPKAKAKGKGKRV